MISSLKTGINGGSVADGVQTWSRGDLYPWSPVFVETLAGSGRRWWQNPNGDQVGQVSYTAESADHGYDLSLELAKGEIALAEAVAEFGLDLEYDNPANWLCYDSSENVT